MNALNQPSLIRKFATFVGVAGISLISFPTLAQLKPASTGLNESHNQTRVAQQSGSGTITTPGSSTTPGTTTGPGTTAAPGTTTAPGRTNPRTSLSAADRRFVALAAQDNLLEIQLSRMAVQRANSPAVKQFAQRMIQDHTQASRDLAPLAARKGVRLPTALNNQNRTRMTQLANLSGTQFDQAYMSEMINSHAQDATLFQTEAQQGRDQDLRAYAAKYLPIIQGHLQMARSMVQPRT